MSARMRGGGDVDKRASAAGCARHSAISDQDNGVGTEENVPARKRGEPEERGPLKGTRLHDAEWVGLRSVARHTDESFEFVRTCASHCLAPLSARALVHGSEERNTHQQQHRRRGDTSRHARAAGARIGTNKNRPVPVRPLKIAA